MDNGDSWPFMAHGIPSPMWDAIPRPHPCRKEETSSTSTLGRGFRWRLAWSRTSAGVQRRKHQCIKELNAEYDPYKNRLQFMIRNCSLCSKLRWLCECETLLCAKRIHVINTSNNNKPTIWGRFIGSFLASPPYVSTSWSPPSWPCQATVEMRSERCCRVFFVSHSDLMVPKVSPGAQGLPREKDPARQPITVTTAWGTTGGCWIVETWHVMERWQRLPRILQRRWSTK